jgi:signal transduction histidine kinase
MGSVRRAVAGVTGGLAARPGAVDGVAAVLLTAAGLIGLGLSGPGYGWPAEGIAAGCSVVATMSVAWRRRAPFAATLTAVTSAVAYSYAAGDKGGAFALAVVLDFYAVGRLRTGRGDRLRLLALLAYAYSGFVAVAASFGQASVASIIQNGLPVALVPALAGALVAHRSALTGQKAANAERLAVEQDLRSAAAAAEERSRVARELHDVVAHSVSVMVIQAGAARLTVTDEPVTATAAVRVVVAAGREAMSDLRRIMGVLRRDDAPGEGQRGVARVRSLIERVSAGGLATEMVVEGTVVELPADVDLVAYRIVQEALTNALKHAGPARACVRLGFAPGAIGLEITNTCVAGGEAARDPTGSGQGLRGMRERVSSYGGTLHAGSRPDGGYEVRARIPLDRREADGPSASAGGQARSARQPGGGSWRRTGWWWRDDLLAVVLIVALESDALLSAARRGPLMVNIVLVAAMSVAAVFRRRWPLLFLVVVNLLAVPLSGGLTAIDKATLVSTYVFVVPTYTVAAWSGWRRAAVGLAVAVSVPLALGPYWHVSTASIIGDAALTGAVWGVGRIARSERALAGDVQATAARLAAEREVRERLAIASERTRIVRDLHALVARDVIAMVVQAEAIGGQLGDSPAVSIEALAAIERTGREALIQMRSILGILRARHEPAELDPSPGIGQVHALVQSSRAEGRSVALTVSGEPGPLLGGVDVIAYRIIEEALRTAGSQDCAHLAIAMRFVPENLELELCGEGVRPPGWPSAMMTRRVARCDGEILADSGDTGEPRITIRLPRNLQASLA